MSSVDFVRVLTEVGYPRAKELKPCDWDWMFELGGGAGAFLSWLCRSVSEENVVSAGDRAAYTRLREVDGVLEGTRLDEALAAQEEADGDLESEAEQLEMELEARQAALERLKRTRDQLCNENLSLSMELNQLTDSVTSSRRARHRLRQRVSGDALALSEARGRLATAARVLTQQLGDSHGAMLSRAPLNGIEATEQRLSERLAELARRAFSSARGPGGAGDCSLLDLRPGRLAAEAAHSALGQQLARLERVLPAAKHGALRAGAEATGLREAVRRAEKLVADPEQRALVSSQPVVASGAAHNGDLDSVLSAAAERYVQGLLARACVGDHAEKARRQEVALQRQREARAAAVQQLARLEWLRRAVAAESGGVATAGDTLTAAESQAADRLEKLNQRMRLMDRAAALSADPPDDAVGPLVASLQPAPGPSPEVVQTQHRAALAELMSSAARRLRTGRRLEATLSRSGVSARCARLEQAVRGLQPELKALLRQWEERRGGRRLQDTLWMLMMTSPARVEEVVVEAEKKKEEAAARAAEREARQK